MCDVDGDGFDDNGSVCGGDDCFDNAELIYPGATESINGIDDNCDGIVDESTVVFDDDNDGYTENAGDCDDSDSQSTCQHWKHVMVLTITVMELSMKTQTAMMTMAMASLKMMVTATITTQ